MKFFCRNKRSYYALVQLILQYNLTKKECYWGEDIDFDVCSDDQIIKVGIIVSEFKFKLELMEKYFIYIQERYHYFTDPNSDFKLILRNKRKLKKIKESLDTKIRGSIKWII